MNTPGESVRDFYRKQGAAAERERIIKLLTEIAILTKNEEGAVTYLQKLRTLIKGQNNA